MIKQDMDHFNDDLIKVNDYTISLIISQRVIF